MNGAEEEPRTVRSVRGEPTAVGSPLGKPGNPVAALDETLADHIVAGLAPPTARAADLPVPLPLADIHPPPRRDESQINAVGRINPSRGVAATHALDALKWHTDDRLDVSGVRNVVEFRGSTRGLHIDSKRQLILVPLPAVPRAARLAILNAMVNVETDVNSPLVLVEPDKQLG